LFGRITRSLLSSAIALRFVAEVGGFLSHGGIVCREMGIPAVTSAVNPIKRLKNGMQIRVIGNTGIIDILSSSATTMRFDHVLVDEVERYIHLDSEKISFSDGSGDIDSPTVVVRFDEVEAFDIFQTSSAASPRSDIRYSLLVPDVKKLFWDSPKRGKKMPENSAMG